MQACPRMSECPRGKRPDRRTILSMLSPCSAVTLVTAARWDASKFRDKRVTICRGLPCRPTQFW